VVGRDHVVQHGKTEALLRLKYPMQVTAPIASKFFVRKYLVKIELLALFQSGTE